MTPTKVPTPEVTPADPATGAPTPPLAAVPPAVIPPAPTALSINRNSGFFKRSEIILMNSATALARLSMNLHLSEILPTTFLMLLSAEFTLATNFGSAFLGLHALKGTLLLILLERSVMSLHLDKSYSPISFPLLYLS